MYMEMVYLQKKISTELVTLRNLEGKNRDDKLFGSNLASKSFDRRKSTANEILATNPALQKSDSTPEKKDHRLLKWIE